MVLHNIILQSINLLLLLMIQMFIFNIYYILLTCSSLGPSWHPDLSSVQSVEYSSLSSSLLPPYWLSSPAYPDKLYSGCAVVFPCVRLPASFPWCPGSLYTKFPARTFSPAGLALLLSLPVATKNVTDLEFLQPGNTIIVNIFVISFL